MDPGRGVGFVWGWFLKEGRRQQWGQERGGKRASQRDLALTDWLQKQSSQKAGAAPGWCERAKSRPAGHKPYSPPPPAHLNSEVTLKASRVVVMSITRGLDWLPKLGGRVAFWGGAGKGAGRWGKGGGEVGKAVGKSGQRGLA